MEMEVFYRSFDKRLELLKGCGSLVESAGSGP